MKIAEERLTDILGEFVEITKAHYKEIALYQDKIPLDPAWDKYLELDKAGNITCVTARDDGELVGYAVFIQTPHIHYQTTVYAHNDVLYLAPEYRGGSLGVDLLVISESALITKGVDVVYLHMKSSKPWHKLAEACGFSLIEYGYSKFIGE